MPKSLCIIHANCQGDALKCLLEHHPDFTRFFQIEQYYNYKNILIPEERLAKCSLFLYQHLGNKWGELSSPKIKQKLPNSCTTLEIPNFFFKGYWPHWTNKCSKIDFADSIIESLIDKGLDYPEIAHLYLREDGFLLGNTLEIAEKSLTIEEEKERNAPIKYSYIIRENWQSQQLFITVNHPANSLYFHVASQVLDLIGLAGLDRGGEIFENPHDDFWLPIHPALAGLSGLSFVAKEKKYRVFSREMTYAQYVACYLGCRQMGVANILAFLNNLK